MKTITQIKTAYITRQPLILGVIGDSTAVGYGANGGPNNWTNGLPYGYLNQPYWSPNWPNWTPTSPYKILVDGDGTNRIATESENNPDIPGIFQLLRVDLQDRNSSSEIWNYAASGENTPDAISKNRVSALAACTPKPDAVIIALGINDIEGGASTSRSTWFTNFNTIIQLCLDNDMLPIPMMQHNICHWDATFTVTPDQWDVMTDWDLWQADIATIAASFGLDYIDGYTPTVPFDITTQYDPAHRNAAGYLQTKNIITTFLNDPTIPNYKTVIHKKYNGVAYQEVVHKKHNGINFREVVHKKIQS